MRAGTKHTLETRAKQSANQKAAWERRRLNGTANHSLESRQNTSRAAILKWQKLAIAIKALKLLGM